MDLKAGRALAEHEMVELLQEARARTLLLVSPLPAEELRVQHDPLMSPIVWDLGHIAHFEEVWLLEKLSANGAGEGEGLRGIYDPFKNPRAKRDQLPLPDATETLQYLARIRSEVITRLPRLAHENENGLSRDAVVRMVLQHEYQHNETILQTLQLKRGAPYPAKRALELDGPAAAIVPPIGTIRPPRGRSAGDIVPPIGTIRPPRGRSAGDIVPPAGTMIRLPGGSFEIGTDDTTEAYDNERPRHAVTLAPFWIDALAVTCGSYLEFISDGGYERRELWSEEGWSWRTSERAVAPRYWRTEGGTWKERVMDREREVDPLRPVCHVCWHEAEAFARWAGKRLPTEMEWEAAAAWDPASGRMRRFPWGDEPATPALANVDALSFDTAPVGTYARNVSPIGCYGMIGDVWEWTASDFTGYPGFRAHPYREYSEVFFGSEYKVLRGGSWASRSGVVRNTFRNWDYPIRRQIFSGFRCARDD
jgi:iron(II)-dependent oxidoreductase